MNMKATGIVRRIDELGRVVIPMELRKTLGIGEKDALEIFTDEEKRIILRKYEPGCTFCGDHEIKVYHGGKPICNKCAYQIVNGNIAADLKKSGSA